VICKQAGASLIIVTGTSKDGARMEVAKELGADHVIDVRRRIRSRASWRSPAARAWTWLSTVPRRRDHPDIARGGSAQAQGRDDRDPGRNGGIPEFPGRKGYGEVHHHQECARPQLKACELALQQLASHRFPLEKVTTHTFGLKDVISPSGPSADTACRMSFTPR
jgi:hypothetical protein